jgi:transposase
MSGSSRIKRHRRNEPFSGSPDMVDDLRKGEPEIKKPLTLGLRWPVERTNSWQSNFGQLRRDTDRFSPQRLGQIALAIALIRP